ncbi:branched-chain amino acid ABC transporter permease [Enhydrobacter sp.]|jgi:branched-chain amino acid transport system permease protein|uniref:branched-chain amino acid ABC transporter permease n=1 Tax=Enhydrobacter sp. TaxID=1894999 RepID=UPI0026258B66|nr:branched-chain amino acid ABC transporter permease [Enhydrobacter sp.]WIM14250.1 MAG: high-affinity branched-chain amino acid transport system permease protein LivH [Enhydrobacter sp.]
MPSATLLGQALISGVLAGGMYGLLAMGLSLSWGLLRLVNLSHFALAFLSAYIVYELGTTWHVAPWWSAALVVPAMFGIGAAQHWLFDRFRVNELASLLITFSVAVILEAGIQLYWTADFRRYETPYATRSIKAGPFFIPVLELALCLVAGALAWGTWLWLRKTFVGKALRASAEDAGIAAAYGVNHRQLAYLLSGVGAGYAGIAGTFIALIATLAPAEIWTWLGVVFAVVIIGRLGNPLGALLAGMLIGASQSVAMAIFSPAWAPVVSFSMLIVVLLWDPEWI